MVSQTQDSQEPSAKRVRRSGSNDVQLSTDVGTENINDMKVFDLCGPASSKTLIMGDGNLSFSLAYARKFDSVEVDATVLEEEDEFYSRYGEDSRDTTKALSQMAPRVRVFFDVDATEVTTYPKEQTSESSGAPLPENEDPSSTNTPLQYARIIMNYPHHGGKTNLKHSKALMKNIFSAVSEVLTPDSVFCLTLAKGQPEVSFSKSTPISNASVSGFRHRKDSWQVLYLAAEFGLRCECASPFNPEHFPGYTPAGYLTSKKGFHNQDGTTFFFKKISTLDDPNVGQYLSDGVNQLLPHFEHHFSVSIVKDDADWSQVERLIHDTSKGTITEISEVEKLRGFDPNTNSENRVYSTVVQSPIPLTRAKCAKYVEETLRPALKEALDKIGFVL